MLRTFAVTMVSTMKLNVIINNNIHHEKYITILQKLIHPINKSHIKPIENGKYHRINMHAKSLNYIVTHFKISP